MCKMYKNTCDIVSMVLATLSLSWKELHVQGTGAKCDGFHDKVALFCFPLYL